MRLSRLLTVASFAVALPLSGWAATPAQMTAAQTSALAWLYQKQNTNGTWSSVPALQVPATSAVLDALQNAGVSRGATFNAAVAALTNADPSNTDALARQLDTLGRTGNDTSSAVALLTSWSNAYSAWGTLPGQSTNIADTSLALKALLDTSSSYPTSSVQAVFCDLVSGQMASGGWGYTFLPNVANIPSGLQTPAILPTVYALLALQQINVTRFTAANCTINSVTSSYSPATMMTNGVNWLLTKKNADNGFGENGTSGALETALTLRALNVVAPGNAAISPAQDYLIAQQNSNGSWNGDALQTAFAIQAFPSTTLTDTQGTGVPDAVASIIWGAAAQNPRSLVPNNGQAVSGTNTSPLIASGTLNQAFNSSLPAPSGCGPFTYKLLSGNLPDGVTLASNGTLSGTPTVAGTFNITYSATDACGKSTTQTAEFVTSDPSNADVPTLPQWGAIVMAALLLLTTLTQRRPRRR